MIIKDVVARKEYLCDVCNKPILKGEKYTRLTTEPYDWEMPDESRSPYMTFHRHKKCNTSWEMLLAYADDEYLGMAYDGGIYHLMPDIFSEYDESLVLEELIQLYNTAHSGENGKKKVVDLFASKGYSPNEIDDFLNFIEFLIKRVQHKDVDLKTEVL
mgnify:CR=1 FL=1